MLVLTIRTDKAEAEVGLYINGRKLSYEVWQAHRHLSETIHLKIEKLLAEQDKKWADLEGIVGFQGPGSFTGLRIGLAVANAIAASLSIPIVGSQDDEWIEAGIHKLVGGQNDHQVMPEYGSAAHITTPKK